MTLFKQKNLNEIARKLREGNQGAGEEIFNYFSPKFFGFFMVRISHRETAEDLTQSVFLKLVKKISTFDEKAGNFSSWFWQIARNTLTDHYRRQKPVLLSDTELENQAISETKESPFNDLMEKEKIKEIIKATEKMNKEEQEIFSLHYLSGVSYRELSETLNKPEPTLRVAVHRINQKIKKVVNENSYD